MNIGITLVIQGLAFFAVAWLVMTFGWPNIMSAIEERQKKIADGLAAADRGQKDLDDAKAQAAEIVKEARVKAAQVIDQANRRSNALVDEARAPPPQKRTVWWPPPATPSPSTRPAPAASCALKWPLWLFRAPASCSVAK
jgi:polyhydroxyalkanoate synthesis regulator phasin